jgi:hypothetical protein
MEDRARPRRTGTIGAALTIAIWLAIAGAGVLACVAALLPEGIAIGGSACGGPTATLPQVCRHIERELSLADLRWFSWATIAGCVLLVLVGIFGAVRPGWRPLLSLAALTIVFVGLVGVAHVDNRFCPGGDTVATCGRTDGKWGPVLRDPLLALRAETRAELVGRPARPGGPVFEEEQTMETFRARALDGFELLTWVAVVAMFSVSLVAALLWIRPAPIAVVAALTGSLVVGAAVWDWTTPCGEEGCPELRGLLTAGAVAVSGMVWAVTLAALAVVSRVRRRSARSR